MTQSPERIAKDILRTLANHEESKDADIVDVVAHLINEAFPLPLTHMECFRKGSIGFPTLPKGYSPLEVYLAEIVATVISFQDRNTKRMGLHFLQILYYWAESQGCGNYSALPVLLQILICVNQEKDITDEQGLLLRQLEESFR